jgi:hypothetical protein
LTQKKAFEPKSHHSLQPNNKPQKLRPNLIIVYNPIIINHKSFIQNLIMFYNPTIDPKKKRAFESKSHDIFTTQQSNKKLHPKSDALLLQSDK